MTEDQIIRVLEAIEAQKIKTDTRNVWCCCPLSPWTHERGTDRRPSCSVKISPDDQSVFICWGCKESGRFADLIYRVHRHTGRYGDLAAQVEQDDQPNLGNMLARAMEEGRSGGSMADVRTPEREILDPREAEPYLGGVPEYVLERGITLDTCREWSLGYDTSPRDPRLVFPVYDMWDNLVGIVGRTLLPYHGAKYKNYIGFQSTHFLYGENKLREREERPLLLVEGMLDVLRCWQSGLVRPLGIFGSRLTVHRATKVQMFAGAGAVLTLFDPDKAGADARKSADRFLRGTVPLFHLHCPEGKDPGDLDEDELRHVLKVR